MTVKGNLVLGKDWAEGFEYVLWPCPTCGQEPPAKLTLPAWLAWFEDHHWDDGMPWMTRGLYGGDWND